MPRTSKLVILWAPKSASPASVGAGGGASEVLLAPPRTRRLSPIATARIALVLVCVSTLVEVRIARLAPVDCLWVREQGILVLNNYGVRALRIALVTDCYWPRVNGVTVSVQTFKDELIRQGHEVLILCPEYPSSWGPSPRDSAVRRFRSMTNRVSKEDRLIRPSAFPAFITALEQFNPDVVHINTEMSASIAARSYAKLRGYPILVTSHTDYEDYIGNYITYVPERVLRATVRFLMRVCYGSADVVITPSRTQQQKLKAYHIRKRFIVIPTGICSYFSRKGPEEVAAYRASLDERFPALKGKRLLLFAGRLTIEKDVKFLIPALRRILSCRDDVALLFAGGGPAREQTEAYAKRAGVAEKCVFMGYVEHDELPLVYASAEVFVFPSKTETQGLSRSRRWVSDSRSWRSARWARATSCAATTAASWWETTRRNSPRPSCGSWRPQAPREQVGRG